MDHINENRTYSIVTLKLAHLALTVGLFYIFWLLFRYHSLTDIDRYGFRYNYFIAFAYGALFYFFSRTYNAYLLGYLRIREMISGQFLSQLFSLILIYLIVTVGWNKLYAPWIFMPFLGILFVFDIVWSYFSTWYFFKHFPKRKTLLIYRNSIDKRRLGSINGKPAERLYVITDELKFDGSFNELEPKLSGFDAIFVAGVNSACRDSILRYCKENGISGFFLPHVGDTIMREATHIQAFDSPVLYVTRKSLNPIYALIKRFFDIVSSALGLIILSPIMFITAMIIRLYDGGPAFYKQTRLTKDGKEFKIIKFRSMRVDAEKDGIARLSTGDNDDRITPIGKLIRKFRIDELPQLWNIFTGDMSVVGPRPERPEIADQYRKIMPEFDLRLQVKAGLTGYAQVYGKYNTEPYEKMEFDLLYIERMNILTDLQLCFATFAILFRPESTAGIDKGSTTALDPVVLSESKPE